MIKNLKLVISNELESYRNQALETFLLESVKDNELILYFWANKKCVFIGRNQNPYLELDVERLYQDGGVFLRRYSGGGAVFHDIGNINYTIITKEKDHNLDLFKLALKNAFKSLDLDVTFSGRNDLLIDGAKISGCAYLSRTINGEVNKLQHGTILVSLYPQEIAKYLTPSKSKLIKNGVRSIESRVTCLKNIDENISIKKVVDAVIHSFENTYNVTAVETKENYYIESRYIEIYNELTSKEWLFANCSKKTFSSSIKDTSIDVELFINNDIIEQIEIYTDSMDICFNKSIKEELLGININRIKSLSADAQRVIKDYQNAKL